MIYKTYESWVNLNEAGDFSHLDQSEFPWYAIHWYADGTLYGIRDNAADFIDDGCGNPFEDEFREIFQQIGKPEIWEQASDADFERRDNDLYFYDPQNETGVALGRMGDGWCCLYENYFEEA